jgi:hypothetical protein
MDAEGAALLSSWIASLGGDTSSRLVNLSVRTRAGAGDQTLIMGFVVDGAGPAQLLVRALGPTLTQFGVNGALSDSKLQLFDAAHREIDENDDWVGGSVMSEAVARMGATALTNGSKDAALLISPSAGAYSAHVTGANATTGTALVELYDAASSGAGRLVNASARSLSGVGDDVLILGFVVDGDGARTLLIRGVGPTLAASGVVGFLANPNLVLYRNGSVVAENDNWGGTSALRDAFARVGAFDFSSSASKDAALLVTLQPGVYSAVVSGVGGTSGVALVEIYELR